MRLARVGLETVTGFVLMKDYNAGRNTIEQVPVAEVNELSHSEKGLQFVDVRQPGEYAAVHAYRASNLPLNTLDKSIDKLDPTRPTFVICQTGYRSSLATSILENAGFKTVYNVAGGTSAWIEADFETEREAAAQAG